MQDCFKATNLKLYKAHHIQNCLPSTHYDWWETGSIFIIIIIIIGMKTIVGDFSRVNDFRSKIYKMKKLKLL